MEFKVPEGLCTACSTEYCAEHTPMCDGNGECFRLEASLSRLRSEVEELQADRDKLLVAVSCMMESAVPNQRDHPAMWKAWKFANEVLDSVGEQLLSPETKG
jgi:hypothetical protein